jgi:YcaO cyclodehydratase, ATP-ad Mg2+-binding
MPAQLRGKAIASAARPMFEDAALTALLELAERDQAVRSFHTRSLQRVECPTSCNSIEYFVRQANLKSNLWRTQGPVPCFVAAVATPDGERAAFGAAADLTELRAAQHALQEACQMWVRFSQNRRFHKLPPDLNRETGATCLNWQRVADLESLIANLTPRISEMRSAASIVAGLKVALCVSDGALGYQTRPCDRPAKDAALSRQMDRDGPVFSDTAK